MKNKLMKITMLLFLILGLSGCGIQPESSKSDEPHDVATRIKAYAKGYAEGRSDYKNKSKPSDDWKDDIGGEDISLADFKLMGYGAGYVEDLVKENYSGLEITTRTKESEEYVKGFDALVELAHEGDIDILTEAMNELGSKSKYYAAGFISRLMTDDIEWMNCLTYFKEGVEDAKSSEELAEAQDWLYIHTAGEGEYLIYSMGYGAYGKPTPLPAATKDSATSSAGKAPTVIQLRNNIDDYIGEVITLKGKVTNVVTMEQEYGVWINITPESDGTYAGSGDSKLTEQKCIIAYVQKASGAPEVGEVITFSGEVYGNLKVESGLNVPTLEVGSNY